MHSVSDLTTFSRKTSGDVPPKLVGASTSVVGDQVYLYGGRLVTERRMVTDMYVFDLKTLVWEKVVAPADDCTPAQRYFHSADSWNQYLIIFGGMGLKPEADDSTEDLCVLNDVCFYDIPARRWMPPSWSINENPLVSPPKPRYAHLSSVSGDRLFIIGGQDLDSVWLDDVYIFDLSSRTWVLKRGYPRHCGTYRSVAVSADLRVHLPQEEGRNTSPGNGTPLFRAGKSPPASTSLTSRETLIHLPYSTQPTDDFPNEIFLYSNYNFTDVKRELEILTPLPNGEFKHRDASLSMNGPAFPPGLRFPAGAILGTHLIIAGTYLAHSFQSFSVWALNLIDMSWSRIDPGSTLATGSWFRSGLWAKGNKFIVFGNRQGNLVEDYNRRLLSWDHIAMIDLEAFGIYQPPTPELDIRMQEIGLAALEEGVLADFEIVCDDDRRVKCSRKLLEDRWPWFKEQRRLFVQTATRALDTLPLSTTHVALPDVPSATQEPRPDPRLTPRFLNLSEPYPITLALVQYFYSLGLITPLQHAPAVLSALLVLATNYDLGHLQSLVKHAMHRALSNSTSVGVYEVATLCSCRSLQIRALKTVMLFNQRRPSNRPRQDREGGPSGPSRTPDTNGNSGNGSAGDQPPTAQPRGMTARPRGMSDTPIRPSDQRQASGGGVVRGANVTTITKDEPESLVRGTASGSTTKQLFLERKPRRGKSLMSAASVMDEALEAVEIIAELHSPIMIDPSELNPVEEEPSRPTHGDVSPRRSSPPASKPERRNLRVDTQLSHVHFPPPLVIAESSKRSSSTTASTISTSEPDAEETRSRRAVRSMTSFPSFHLPHRTRSSSYREKSLDTPPLTSASLTSLTSGSSPMSQTSGLYTPPHSPLGHAFVHTETTTPSSSHLSPISELQSNEDHTQHLFLQPKEGKSTQTITRTEPPGSSSAVHDESDGRGQAIAPLNVSSAPHAQVYHSKTVTYSPTGTVIGLVLTSSSPSTVPVLSPTPTHERLPTPPSVSPSPTRHLSIPTTTTGGRTWPFGGGIYRSSSRSNMALSAPDAKADKAAEKKRKKAEARAQREQLALELKKKERRGADEASVHSSRSNERILNSRPWEEDIAVYGSLASM